MMNTNGINQEDQIIIVKCADCHRQTIYLKIMNAAHNTRPYNSQRIICSQCQLTKSEPPYRAAQHARPLNETA